MPVVGIIVGAIGSAVGSAVATGVFGAVAGGIGAAIGAAVGAGIAGGLMASAMGGSFGKGFLMGAAGSAVGSFLKGGLGDTLGGATQAADGTTSADIFASQGGADFAPTALEGVGEVAGEFGGATGVETFGLGESGGAVGTSLDAGGSLEGSGGLADIGAGGMTTTPTTDGGGLADQFGTVGSTGVPMSTSTLDPGFQSGNMMTPELGFSETIGGDQFALPDGVTSESPLLSTDYSAAGAAPTAQGLEGFTPAPAEGSYPMSSGSTGSAPQSNGGIGGMFKTSDAWLKNNLGMPQGSTGKLLMGGAQTLMDYRAANKLGKQVDAQAPLSFEQYQEQFMNPGAYKTAANRMASSGRTGTLPILLARMKNEARGDYTKYRTGQDQRNLENKAAVSRMKSNSLSNLFAPYAMNQYAMGGG